MNHDQVVEQIQNLQETLDTLILVSKIDIEEDPELLKRFNRYKDRAVRRMSRIIAKEQIVEEYWNLKQRIASMEADHPELKR